MSIRFNCLRSICLRTTIFPDSIEDNIDTTAANVEGGTAELQKASQYQQKYRKRLCYLALIGTVILIILIIILVVELKR